MPFDDYNFGDFLGDVFAFLTMAGGIYVVLIYLSAALGLL